MTEARVMDWEKITAELEKPLNRVHVKPPAPGKYGDYIEGWHVISEANRIFGFNGWSYEILDLAKTNAASDKGMHHIGFLCTVSVTVGDVRRQDVGHGQGHGKSEGDAYDSAIKEAVTDALKRALRTFGNPFGLALYDKTQANVVDTAKIELNQEAEAARDFLLQCLAGTQDPGLAGFTELHKKRLNALRLPPEKDGYGRPDLFEEVGAAIKERKQNANMEGAA